MFGGWGVGEVEGVGFEGMASQFEESNNSQDNPLTFECIFLSLS